MLQLVNLAQSKDLYCKALSGGMKRRLSLACAFVGDMKIVLLDEVSESINYILNIINQRILAIEWT
jgi:ABC-type multidrug transport system ATPase subunit